MSFVHHCIQQCPTFFGIGVVGYVSMMMLNAKSFHSK